MFGAVVTVYDDYADVVYSCVYGFEIVGVARRVCPFSTGKWEERPVCRSMWFLSGVVFQFLISIFFSTEVWCGEPLQPIYTAIVREPLQYQFETEIEYECLDGYELFSGHLIRECEVTGNWSDTAPTCRSKCFFSSPNILYI